MNLQFTVTIAGACRIFQYYYMVWEVSYCKVTPQDFYRKLQLDVTWCLLGVNIHLTKFPKVNVFL